MLDGETLEQAKFGDGVASVIGEDFNLILRPLVSEFTGVNVWDRKLGMNEMRDWTNCK